MSELRGNKTSFPPNKIVLTAGATSANETLIFCLANRGDAFLLPTPYYPGFDRDLKWRTDAEIVPIHCSSSNGFRLTKTALDNAFRRATKLNLQVKGILVTNPSNPLGTTMTSAELDTLADFIQVKNLHLICDEIYSGTSFIAPADFISFKQVVAERPHLSKQVHIVYSLSKDLGLPGFRVGAIYSDNDLVVEAATKMSSFGLISSQTQYLLSMMLGDKEFTRNYIAENKKRLKERHCKLVNGLRNIGIECLESNAGLFCWVDMRHLLKKNSFDGEMELWKKIVYNVGLNISPGSSCHCTEPGWFRVCFANMTEATLDLAVQRLKEFVESGAVMRRHRRLGSAAISRWVRRLSTASEKRVEQMISR